MSFAWRGGFPPYFEGPGMLASVDRLLLFASGQ